MLLGTGAGVVWALKRRCFTRVLYTIGSLSKLEQILFTLLCIVAIFGMISSTPLNMNVLHGGHMLVVNMSPMNLQLELRSGPNQSSSQQFGQRHSQSWFSLQMFSGGRMMFSLQHSECTAVSCWQSKNLFPIQISASVLRGQVPECRHCGWQPSRLLLSWSNPFHKMSVFLHFSPYRLSFLLCRSDESRSSMTKVMDAKGWS